MIPGHDRLLTTRDLTPDERRRVESLEKRKEAYYRGREFAQAALRGETPTVAGEIRAVVTARIEAAETPQSTPPVQYNLGRRGIYEDKTSFRGTCGYKVVASDGVSRITVLTDLEWDDPMLLDCLQKLLDMKDPGGLKLV